MAERLRLGSAGPDSLHDQAVSNSQGESWQEINRPTPRNLREAHFAQQRTGAFQDSQTSRKTVSTAENADHVSSTSHGSASRQNYISEVAAPQPVTPNSNKQALEQMQGNAKANSSIRGEEESNLTEATVPPPAESEDTSGDPEKGKHLESANHTSGGRTVEQPNKAGKILTQIYIISHLVFFSILGTLARLGVQWITFYPGAPIVISNIWANFGGTMVMGFLSEDRKLFMEEWGDGQSNSHKGAHDGSEKDDRGSPAIRANHSKVKKTIPLFIGLTTGFCGSFTSFSTFMRDIFYALSNEMPSPISHPSTATSTVSTVPRNGGYSSEAILAVVILTVTASIGALKLGAHMAIGIDRFTPTLPFSFVRKVLDPLVVFLGMGCWVGAVVMAALPPDRPGGPQSKGVWSNEVWRGQVLFGLVFAPLGCIMRFYLSAKLNGKITGFPLGTFAANIFGTAVFGMGYDLQRAPLTIGSMAIPGGGRVGCQVLQGIEDGFCGCLTTVSTWALELTTLRRKHAYVYGGASVLTGLALVVIIMGSAAWTIGLSDPVCAVEVS